MKYVVIVDQFGTEQPIVFSEVLNHSIFTAGRVVVAAGFCKFQGSRAKVWGESVSLKLKSRPEDVDLLERMLRF
jgi:hypothetical protein